MSLCLGRRSGTLTADLVGSENEKEAG
jgi:hypothetical protein